MKRFILAAGIAVLLSPLTASAQPGYGRGGYNDAPEQMVRDWYSRFLGRAPDGQSSVWVEAVRSGQQPEAVLGQILGSSEYYMRAGSTPQGFVRRLYTDLTGRPPGPGETRNWLNRMYQSDRQDVAYQMLQRYPQGGVGSTPQEDYQPEPTYEYRRPVPRYYPR